MQVFIKFSVGLDAVELLKQIDELGESIFIKRLLTRHVRNVKTIAPMRHSFLFLFLFFVFHF